LIGEERRGAGHKPRKMQSGTWSYDFCGFHSFKNSDTKYDTKGSEFIYIEE
jgi:hypothetical protein